MVIKLYKTTDDPKVVNKTLTDEISITGVCREPVNVINPVIEFEGDNTTIAGYNYAYIEDYARFYFLEPQAESYNLNTLILHSDPLMTAKPWLLQRIATITRNQSLYNAYLSDPEFASYAYTNVVLKAFPYEIANDSIILMTVG